MFVSDADFDFAAEQIKKVKFAPFEVTSILLGCNVLFLVTECSLKKLETQKSLQLKSVQPVFLWSFQFISDA